LSETSWNLIGRIERSVYGYWKKFGIVGS